MTPHTFLDGDGEVLRFSHQRRTIVLARDGRDPGHVAFLAKDFSDVLLRLGAQGIACELLHADAGMTRMAILRDPFGNWVHLVETRAF
jgi:catechol 2,3-dioxygenase-like lactoylglutathione lyase family enzyme